jgi:hypothetical protein
MFFPSSSKCKRVADALRRAVLEQYRPAVLRQGLVGCETDSPWAGPGKVVLPCEPGALILQLIAKDARMPCSTAARFSTGSAPGNPSTTGSVWVLGSLPNSCELGEKILVAV